MRKSNGIIINGEWIGDNIVVNDVFRTICSSAPFVIKEFSKLLKAVNNIEEAVTINNLEFPNRDSINIEFSNESVNGLAMLLFRLHDGSPEFADCKLVLNGEMVFEGFGEDSSYQEDINQECEEPDNLNHLSSKEYEQEIISKSENVEQATYIKSSSENKSYSTIANINDCIEENSLDRNIKADSEHNYDYSNYSNDYNNEYDLYDSQDENTDENIADYANLTLEEAEMLMQKQTYKRTENNLSNKSFSNNKKHVRALNTSIGQKKKINSEYNLYDTNEATAYEYEDSETIESSDSGEYSQNQPVNRNNDYSPKDSDIKQAQNVRNTNSDALQSSDNNAGYTEYVPQQNNGVVNQNAYVQQDDVNISGPNNLSSVQENTLPNQNINIPPQNVNYANQGNNMQYSGQSVQLPVNGYSQQENIANNTNIPPQINNLGSVNVPQQVNNSFPQGDYSQQVNPNFSQQNFALPPQMCFYPQPNMSIPPQGYNFVPPENYYAQFGGFPAPQAFVPVNFANFDQRPFAEAGNSQEKVENSNLPNFGTESFESNSEFNKTSDLKESNKSKKEEKQEEEPEEAEAITPEEKLKTILKQIKTLQDEFVGIKNENGIDIEYKLTREEKRDMVLETFFLEGDDSKADSYGKTFNIISSSKERLSANTVDDELFIAGNKLYRWGDVLQLEF